MGVRGIRAADVGNAARNVIPAEATASVDIRLAAGDDPVTMVDRVQAHLERAGYLVLDRVPTPEERRSHRSLARLTRATAYRAARMIKSDLVTKIAAQNPHLYQRDVENIVNAILDEVTAALARGDRVELRGFGAFSVKHRPARTGRNPRTGEHVSVEQKSVPFFKTGKEMRERLNREETA